MARLVLLASLLLLPTAVSGQTCGVQAGGATCPDAWAPCCSQYGWCGWEPAYCDANQGCQSGCTGGGGGGGGGSTNYNYCGSSWADANSSCGRACPGGDDGECLNGDRCYADCTACPAVSTTGSPPSPTPPSGTPPSPTPPTGPTPVATATHHDSRLIAYVGNWQTCPTAQQVDAYTHIVVAFAVTYTWSASQNNCDATCTLPSSVPVCGNSLNQNLVDTWRSQGKKVILSFGGAGMGGSWSGDNNHCWDYCFGKEEALATALTNIVQTQRFDGIDIDYEYCYDTENGSKTGGRHWRDCRQSGTGLYTDAKAHTFLNGITTRLRTKLDALGSGYELTHAPMDADLTTDSPYYQLLKTHNAKLDFLMPQFYNGITRVVADGFANSGAGQVSTASLYSNLANDMFNNEPEKVVFGFCIDDCSFMASNANGAQAVSVLQDVKTYNGGEFACNGGAFFWVAYKDYGGAWSDPVWAEVAQTAGCTAGPPPPTREPTPAPTDPTKAPTPSPTRRPSLTPPPTTRNPTPNPTPWPTAPSPSGPTGGCNDACPTANWDIIGAADCSGYYHCTGGVRGDFLACASGTLWQDSIKGCDWDYNVNCDCAGNPPTPPPTRWPTPPPTPLPTPPTNTPPPTRPPTPPPSNPPPPGTTPPPTPNPTPNPTPPPVQGPTSPAGCGVDCAATETNLLFPRPGCVGFYLCYNYQTFLVDCAPGTLFDTTIGDQGGRCNHDYLVECQCGGQRRLRGVPLDDELRSLPAEVASRAEFAGGIVGLAQPDA